MLIYALLWGSPAVACSLPAPVEHEIDPASTDGVPPSAPEIGEVTIRRGRGPHAVDEDGNVVSTDSCDDLGWINIAVAATDDVSPPEWIGYRVELVAGELPEGLTLRTGAWGGHPWLVWGDGATDDQEPFDATLSIVAVDEGGNESAPAEVDLSDPGSSAAPAESGRCDGSGGHLGAGAVIVAMLAARRRYPVR